MPSGKRSHFAVLLSILVLLGCGATSRIGIFDRFRGSDSGTILDIVTGLQWKVGPDRDLDWYGAGIWISGLEGNWRMPLRDELEQLFEAGITTETWGPFDNSGWLVWCVDYTCTNMSDLFCFIPDDVYFSSHMSPPAGQRVWAVLSPVGYGTVAVLDTR